MKIAEKYNRAVRSMFAKIFSGYKIEIKTAYYATLLDLSYKSM